MRTESITILCMQEGYEVLPGGAHMRHPTLSEARSIARGEEFTDDHLFARVQDALTGLANR